MGQLTRRDDRTASGKNTRRMAALQPSGGQIVSIVAVPLNPPDRGTRENPETMRVDRSAAIGPPLRSCETGRTINPARLTGTADRGRAMRIWTSPSWGSR